MKLVAIWNVCGGYSKDKRMKEGPLQSIAMNARALCDKQY